MLKKLLSIILSIAIIMSVVGVVSITSSATTITPDSSLLTDTTDFDEGLSSIAYSEKLITGYNLGNVFEMTELRSNYTRPAVANIQEHLKYKETMAGSVEITEEYIKYLAESGVQAIRVPITWFNMLEYTGELNGKTYNGEIVDKSVYYASLDERRKLWYNGVINEEFMDRIQQVVDWIIKYGMYCMINTHHDGACTNNSVNPERFSRTVAGTSGETYLQQTIRYLDNIWGQVGERFKNYGSRLMFEPYNEVANDTGHMTPNAETMADAAEVAAAFVQKIRSQGGNNAKRFLVIPNYGGVSFMTNEDAVNTVKAADIVNDVYNDKIILSSHDYSNSMSGAVNSINNIKTRFNVGATLTEIGFSNTSPNASTGLAKIEELYTLSHQKKASCFYWDGGRTDAFTNRYYSCPASAAFAKFVGKDFEYPTYTQSEILALTADSQPNWMKLYSEDSTSEWMGKYLIITSEKKITSLTASKTSQGYYAINGADNGLVTQFISDDGINYKMLTTFIPTSWTRLAWSEFNAIGTTYYAEQVDGNYFLDKIGDGLQKYVTTGDELISKYGGELRNGGYDYSSGNYVSTAGNRICYTNFIDVIPNEWYYFSASTDKRYNLLIRGYDANGNRVCNVTTVSQTAKTQMPSNVYKVSVTIYDSYQSLAYNYDAMYALVDDGTISPTMYHFVSPDAEPDPTSPTTEPTEPSSTEPTTQPIDLSLEMTTMEGASIRLNNHTGLRFYTEVDKDKVTQLRNEGYTVQLGTLIAPANLLSNNALTFELEVGKYADVKYTTNEYYEESSFSGIVGSIVGIKESTTLSPATGNVLRDFVARGYAKITDSQNQTTIVYADYTPSSARSLGYVAYMFRENNMNNDLYLSNQANVDRWADAYADKYDPEADDKW